jgi:hypothetical protein
MGIYSSVTRQGAYEPFDLQVARGQIDGHEQINIFGYATAVSSTFVAVWENNAAYVFPTVASTMVVTSSSASDTAVTILIRGLDVNYKRITELVTLNGTTGVTTTQAFWRINGALTTAGNAVGTVYIKNAGGTTYGQITIGNGQTAMSVYCVPVGYTFYLFQADAWSSTSVTSGVYATYRNSYTDTNGVQNIISTVPFLNDMTISRTLPLAYPEKSDMQFQFKSSGAGLGVGCLVEGILVKNPD